MKDPTEIRPLQTSIVNPPEKKLRAITARRPDIQNPIALFLGS